MPLFYKEDNMFPLNSNTPYIEDTGKRARLGDVVGGGGGSDIPEYDVEDAGKVLMVDDSGELEWATVSRAPRQYGNFVSSIPEMNITTSAEEVTT